MSLPPGFLDDLRARTPISEVIGRRVSWDRRKSNPARGDWWACCPFHDEKSPSFHADDRKGFFHCFGCGASGDAITFLREREAMDFMEAVAELARIAGVPMPQEDPAGAARARERKGLAELMEQAARFYRRRLAAPEAARAREYLARRGLSADLIGRFEIGFAPSAARAAIEHLISTGAELSDIVAAGLAVEPEGGGRAYDRFRDRVMFPIRDARGACIAFGGRAMGDGGGPKYLNSPQTALFDKSRTLYNHGPAREAAAKSGSLVVVEGYMDVIAVSGAGFAHAVAPLGTAVTGAHLEAMWRMADEPVFALDGDRAGLAAAMRVLDVAAPLLKPGKSLRFALLPPDRDPDDLIRAEGAGAFRALLESAEPMVSLLWRRETEDKRFETPEQRAALDLRLRTVLDAFSDASVKSHYRAALAERRSELFRPARRMPARTGGFSGDRRAPKFSRRWTAPPEGPRPQTKASALARVGADLARDREAAILLAMLRHPELLERRAEELDELLFANPELEALRREVSSLASAAALTDAAGWEGDHRVAELRARLAKASSAAHLGFAGDGVDVVSAERGLVDAMARSGLETQLRREVSDAEAALLGEADSAVDGRLSSAALAAALGRAGTAAEADADDSGLSDDLRAALNAEIWKRSRRRRDGSNH